MRRTLVAVAILAGLGLSATAATLGVLYVGARTTEIDAPAFERPLPIPPVADSRRVDGRVVHDLDLVEGRAEIRPGTAARTWGVNGPHLGPTLRLRRGDHVEMAVRNSLPEPTTLHWHGLHLPGSADGGPHQAIPPGDTWRPTWRVDQPAATLWYHPHPHGRTADHVYRGLAGMIIVDDPARPTGLPSRYGEDDIPLLLQDVRLGDDGSLDFSQGLISPTGRLGGTILVNGVPTPRIEVDRAAIRFRVLNASGARVYRLGFDDGRPFHLVGTDGGLLDTPVAQDAVQVSPGERVEIVARFRPRERVVLRSSPPDLGTNFFEGRFAGGDDSFDLLEIRAAPRLAEGDPLPERLATGEPEQPSAPAGRRRFELSGTQVNGRDMDMARIDEVVRLGDTEVWEVVNRSGTPHNFHVHGVSFRVLTYAGGAPPAASSGPKDTVYVPPGASVELLIHFTKPADADAPFMFHCHILEHEDRGMMGQFVVVPPGADDGQLGRAPSADHVGGHD